MSVEPGALAIEGRRAYYLAEAERVQALAGVTPAGEGREYLQEVAQEYRNLAAYYAASDDEEPPVSMAAIQARN